MAAPSIAPTVDRYTSRYGPTTLRWAAALLWLSNVSWKIPPDFGQSANRCTGLCRYTEAGSKNPVLIGAPWLFEHVIHPHLTVFGWMTLIVEASLAALLISGRYLRIAAVVGIVQSFAILVAVANLAGEWYWSYLLMIALHLAILVTAPTARPPRMRSAALVTVGYGVVVILAHLGAGLTGDSNRDFDLFSQNNDLPGDFGRNVFPGSILLGVLLVALGVVVYVMRDHIADAVASGIGWAIVALSGVLLLTYGKDGLVIGIGSRATTACVLAGLGLVLARPAAPLHTGDAQPQPDGAEAVPTPSARSGQPG